MGIAVEKLGIFENEGVAQPQTASRSPATSAPAVIPHRRGPGTPFVTTEQGMLRRKLAAAGITVVKRRSLAEIEADLRVAEETVRRYKRERKSLVNSEALKRSKRNPEFIRKWKEGVVAGWADPVKSEARREAARQFAIRQPRVLPPMTASQREIYEVAKKRGLSREAALAAAKTP